MIDFKSFIQLCTLLVLAGCQSVPQKQETSVTLSFANGRYRQVEACGCSLTLLGGTERESNWQKQWLLHNPKTQLLSLSGGVQFWEFEQVFEADFSKLDLGAIENYLSELQKLKMAAMALSVEDFHIPVEKLKTLQSNLSFPFLSANVHLARNNARPFPAFKRIVRGGAVFHVIGLSGVYQEKNIPSNVKIVAWDKALSQALSELPDENAMVVVIHSLGKRAQERLMNQFPQVNILLGGPNVYYSATQYAGRTVLTDTTSRGKELAVLKLTIRDPKFPLFNQEQASRLTYARTIWGRRIADPKATNKKHFSRRLAQTESVPPEPTRDSNPYQFYRVQLDSRYDLPKE